MNNLMAKILTESLRGENAHVGPLHGLEGLNTSWARYKLTNRTHSCWEILHHMNYWQELILTALRGETLEWPEHAAEGWSSTVNDGEDSDWNCLVECFRQGLQEAEELTQTGAMMDLLPSWSNTSKAKAFLVLVLHNSYHLGQIVLLRKQLGIWPPPGGGDTW